MSFFVRSNFGTFQYGRPAGRYSTRGSAVDEAKRRVRAGERAWVLDERLKVVWGKAIRPTKNRVAMGEWWRMKNFDTRPQWVAGEERRRK